MLAERLRKELDEARSAGSDVPAPQKTPAVLPGFEELDRSVKRLATEQRRLAHRIEKMAEAPASPTTALAESIAPLDRGVSELQRMSPRSGASARRTSRISRNGSTRWRPACRRREMPSKPLPRPPRMAASKKGAPERVGVFIDVQNMYYAARQLKGKLDFDALAASVRARSSPDPSLGVRGRIQGDRPVGVHRDAPAARHRGAPQDAQGARGRLDEGRWDMEMALGHPRHGPEARRRRSGLGRRGLHVARQACEDHGAEGARSSPSHGTPRNRSSRRPIGFHPLDRKSMIRTEIADSGRARTVAKRRRSPKATQSSTRAPRRSEALASRRLGRPRTACPRRPSRADDAGFPSTPAARRSVRNPEGPHRNSCSTWK